ncbi:PIN domain-containing protein [Niabella sp. CJ426]|uniref:PIN domain-containing protein n=1 Tax=Niabella sp. CJ426 TaxID=3393740 RepID=UPI003D03BE64
MTYLFLDTNIFLHFQYFEEIPWKEIANSQDFNIVVAPIVLDELDKHKRNPKSKIATRAKKVLSRIEVITQNPDSYPLQYWPIRPSNETLEINQLDRNEQDDLLMASMIEFSAKMQNEAFLITNDTGPLLRARSVNLKVIKISDKYLTPIEQSEKEKELIKVKKELELLKNVLPKTELTFKDKNEFIEVKLHHMAETIDDYVTRNYTGEVTELQPLIYIDAKEKERQLKQKIEEASTNLEKLNLKMREGLSFGELTKEQIEQYNNELNEYKVDYGMFVRKKYAYERFISLSFPVELILSNVGTAPANDIDIWLHFPDGFKLINEGDRPAEPQPPRPPYRPKHRFDMEGSPFFPGNFRFPSERRYPELPSLNSDKPNIRQTNSYEVTIQINSLKHYQLYNIDPLIVVFEGPEQISNFAIDYRVVIGNLPQPVSGKLHVKVSSGLG